VHHLNAIDADMPAYGRAVRAHERKARAVKAAKLAPLPERVADAMREIAATSGSCDMEDLTLRFPDEEITDGVVAAARKIAGKRQLRRVA
jgi:hypothetical protein